MYHCHVWLDIYFSMKPVNGKPTFYTQAHVCLRCKCEKIKAIRFALSKPNVGLLSRKIMLFVYVFMSTGLKGLVSKSVRQLCQ